MTTQTTTGVGRVARVTGPVVDVEFPVEAMPALNNALHVNVSFDTGEEGGEAPEFLPLPLGERVVVALGALELHADEQPADGRDGQHDPEIYAVAAANRPEHVRGVLLRRLGMAEHVLSHGVPAPTDAPVAPARGDE